MAHRIVLIPGFFGFDHLGDLAYWGHVERFLRSALAERSVDGTVVPVHTYPTSSIRQRAARVADVIHTGSGPGDTVHLVGHSTGGIDARVFTTRGVALPTQLDVEALVSRVRTVVSIASPHRGTPTATFFTGLLGQKLLRLLSLFTIYVLRYGHIPLSVAARLGRFVARVDRHAGLEDNVLDELFEQLLGDLGADRRMVLQRFMGEVVADQSLVVQLTPAGIDLVNATATDRDGVRYGSVVLQARPPGLRSPFRIGLDPYAQATHLVYRLIHPLASRMRRRDVPDLTESQRAALVNVWGDVPSRRANDGIVPTLSQVHGEIVHAAWADHLDVLGYFEDPGHRPPHIDWLATGTGFKRLEFERTWTSVLDFLLGPREMER